MSVYTLTFYFFEAVAAISALGLIFSRNVFYGALLLITCLLAIAGLYVLSFAEFVAVTQVMIYAGGVLVLILFGIMLTSKLGDKPLRVTHNYVISGVMLCLPLLIMLAILYHKFFSDRNGLGTSPLQNTEQIGMNLFTSYLLPFELAGILLLAALIGAAVVASSKPKEN